MPRWRNGRRTRLKILRGFPHESSILSRGTVGKEFTRQYGGWSPIWRPSPSAGTTL